jgi:hypothetical protein
VLDAVFLFKDVLADRTETKFKFIPTSIVLIIMSQRLGDYLSEYIKGRVGVFKKYLLAALDNRDQSIWYLEASAGMLIPSADLKNCELLRDAQLFREDLKVSRNGRNTYKLYYLTDLGKKIAAELKAESLISDDQENLLSPATYLSQ